MNPKLSKINVIDMDANLNSEMTTNEWLLYLRNIVIKQNERINYLELIIKDKEVTKEIPNINKKIPNSNKEVTITNKEIPNSNKEIPNSNKEIPNGKIAVSNKKKKNKNKNKNKVTTNTTTTNNSNTNNHNNNNNDYSCSILHYIASSQALSNAEIANANLNRAIASRL